MSGKATREKRRTVTLTSDGREEGIVSSLLKLLEEQRGARHVIVLQDYPDPDAISSAFAHLLISAEFDITCDVLYGGQISHHQNRALVKLLGMELKVYTPEHDLSIYDGSVFVDTQGTNSQITQELERADIPCLIVVDHHDRQGRLKPVFEDIRRVGATATIYAGYLKHGVITLDRSRREHTLCATALMHGILTDTAGFIRAQEGDFMAAAYLSNFSDANLLAEIMSQSRSKYVMDIIRRALENRIVIESYSISGIGYVRAEDRDAIPEAAEFLLTEENVHTAIVYGIVVGEKGGKRQESVVGSMRTLKLTVDPDAFLKEVLGQDAQGGYFGGGKPDAGGFEIPVGFLSGTSTDSYQNLKWQVFDAQIKQRLFAKIGVEQKES